MSATTLFRGEMPISSPEAEADRSIDSFSSAAVVAAAVAQSPDHGVFHSKISSFDTSSLDGGEDQEAIAVGSSEAAPQIHMEGIREVEKSRGLLFADGHASMRSIDTRTVVSRLMKPEALWTTFSKEYIVTKVSGACSAEGGNAEGGGDDAAVGGDCDDAEAAAPVQYRLTARHLYTEGGPMMRFFSRLYHGGILTDVDPDDRWANRPIRTYLNWTFRASFLAVFLSMLLVYIIIVLLFAVFYGAAGAIEPECISVSGRIIRFNDTQAVFGDLYQLSWNTFSTVGYGSVMPSTSFMQPDQERCGGVHFLSSIEAFVGILYSGSCAAVLFSKVIRIHSHAQVIFSDPLCVRFGDGVRGWDIGGSVIPHNNLSVGNGDGPSSADQRAPFPVLEMRVVNERWNVRGGEIVDAQLTCASTSFLISSSPEQVSNRNVEFDEDTTLVRGKRVFYNLEIEPGTHPFFKRVWNIKHVLDVTSPLVKPDIKKMIRKNRGHWPSELNSHKDVRGAIQFDNLIVSFSGVSNTSAASVYAQKIYNFADLNVGYQFAPVLYRKGGNDSGRLGVNLDMINDLMEQEGGCAEPFVVDSSDA